MTDNEEIEIMHAKIKRQVKIMKENYNIIIIGNFNYVVGSRWGSRVVEKFGDWIFWGIVVTVNNLLFLFAVYFCSIPFYSNLWNHICIYFRNAVSFTRNFPSHA